MIVFCHLLNDHSGSPIVLRATMEALGHRENGVLYVGSQGPGVLDQAGVPTRRYWYRRSRYRIVTLVTYLVSQIALYRALSRARDIPTDAVIFVNTLLPFAAMLWARRRTSLVVVHMHEISITPAPLRFFLTQCARRRASLLLYVSNDHHARLPIGGPAARVLPNPVSPALARRAAGHVARPTGCFNVLMLASPRLYKGVKEFIALAETLKTRADIAFTLVLNADLDEARVFAARHSRTGNCTIHPRTDDPADFYQNADLVLNLSRVDQWIETFGLTLAEAMTFGIPVIAPPVGGPAEIVTHGREGFCIDSRDIPALGAAVVLLVDNPDTYATMSEAARTRSRDFSFDAYSTALQAILADIQRSPAV